MTESSLSLAAAAQLAAGHALAARAGHHHRLALLAGLLIVIVVAIVAVVSWRRVRRQRARRQRASAASRSDPSDPEPGTRAGVATAAPQPAPAHGGLAATAPQPAPGRAQAPPGGLLYRIGLWSATHRIFVLTGWIGLLVAATIGSRVLGGVYSNNFSLPGTSAQQGADLLKAHRPSAGGEGGQLVFSIGSGSLVSHRSAIEQSMTTMRGLPDVLSASDPLAPAAIAKGGRVAYASVHFSVNPQSLGQPYLDKVNQAVAPARNAGIAVNYGGQLGQAAKLKNKDPRSEEIGIAAALIILIIGFGSVYAAGLTVLSALAGAFAGLSVLGMVAATTTFATVSPTLAIMIGLGVGIDYALFLATRHRQLVMDGVDPAQAAARSLEASGRAVLVAAMTVVIALLGLYASGLTFIGKLGLAAGITVTVAAFSAITAVPALLALAGRHIDRARIRRPVAEASGQHAGWQRYAERVGAHPWAYLIGGVALLAVLAIPALSMQLGHIDAGSDPAGSTAKKAYDALSAGFGPGANGPFTVVAQLGPGVETAAQRQSLAVLLHAALARTPDVAAVTAVKATPDGALLYATLLPRTDPQAGATNQLMQTLQTSTLPSVLYASESTGYVTGSLAAQLQFRDIVSSRLPLMIAAVIAAAFVLLLLAFRSPILAIKAGLLNLLSIGAAFGVIVAVFQWGWGSSLFGVSEKVPIESYVPMMIFAIVFGLSMDYEVFLLSRVRESWLTTRDNHASVAHGLATTARVISCAALIMTSVFAAFLLSANVTVKMLALGLGLSVLIDASVIRLLVVPAAMFLLGRYNWWTPRWLDRVTPQRRRESFRQPGHREAQPESTPAG